jgi:hypothetical protein
MLHPPAFIPVFPFHFAGLPVDKANGIKVTEADQDVAICQRRDCVGMGELIATLALTNRIGFNVHVVACVPFPHHLPGRSDFVYAVAVHATVNMRRVGEAAGHTSFYLRRNDLPGEKIVLPLGSRRQS